MGKKGKPATRTKNREGTSQRARESHPDSPTDSTNQNASRLNESKAQCLHCEEKERRLDLLQKNLERNKAELDSFVYRVSHDLKAPVVSLYGMASMLLEDYGDRLDENGKHYLRRVMANAGMIERLIGDLLAYSRVGRWVPVPEQLQTEAIVRTLLDKYSGEIVEKKIQVVVRSPLPQIFFDRVRLEQIFSHLIANAIRYMGDQPHPAIEIGGSLDERSATFYVRDNGIGIDPQHHQLIFGVFERLREIEVEGTGMGLALAKKILDLVDGKIWVESKKGEGATFLFALPQDRKGSFA